VAFWQQKANAKCYRVHACTRSMPGFLYYSEVRTSKFEYIKIADIGTAQCTAQLRRVDVVIVEYVQESGI